MDFTRRGSLSEKKRFEPTNHLEWHVWLEDEHEIKDPMNMVIGGPPVQPRRISKRKLMQKFYCMKTGEEKWVPVKTKKVAKEPEDIVL